MQQDRLADMFARRRAWLALGIVLLSVLAAEGLRRLEFDDVPRTVFETDDADFALLKETFEQFGSDDNDCLLVVAADDLFTPGAVQALRRLADDVEAIDRIESVQSLASVTVFAAGRFPLPLLPRSVDVPVQRYEQARRQAEVHPLVAGQLLSTDARTTLVIARVAGDNLSIADIRPVTDRLEALARAYSASTPLDVHVSGLPSIRVEIFTAVRRETYIFVALGCTLGFVMAAVMLRRPAAVLIVSVPPWLGAMWSLGGLGLAGQKVTVISIVLPTLVMVIGFTDAVHLMIDIRRSRAAGMSPLESSKSALKHLVVACALTSFTTAVGFGSLVVAEVGLIRRFGLACASGAVLTFFAVITAVPLLASTRLGLYVHGERPTPHAARRARLVDGLIDKLLKYRWRVAVGGFLATATLGSAAFWLRPDVQLAEAMPEATESYRTLQVVDREFGGVLSLFILVEWDESLSINSVELQSAIHEAQQLCWDTPLVHQPLSVLDLMVSVPGGNLGRVPDDVIRRFIRTDARRAVISARLRDEGSSVHQPMFDQLSGGLRKIENEHPGVRLRLTGSSVLAARNLNQVIVDLAKSLGLASVVIFVVMAVVFRSIKLGLISLLPNVLPMAVTAAALVVSGEPLRMTSVIVFSVCLGIAVDDTIHFLNRFQREMRVDGDVEAAIHRTFNVVGAALITTTIVLITGFASVLVSQMPTSHLFAWLSITAIASALIGDMLILPALLACFYHGERTTDRSPTPSEDAVDQESARLEA